MRTQPEVADSCIGPRSVLCVHSDSTVPALLREALRPAEVAVAANGYEALKSVNTASFDAYVVDYWLPDWSGVSLCREIRTTDPNVPICVYSKAQSLDKQRRALRAGADVFLIIPQDALTVGERLHTLLRSREEHAARAWLAAERAIDAELERQASCVRARGTASQVFERKIRTAALKAFLGVGGTCADFERTWAKSHSRATRMLTDGAAQAA